MQVLRKLPTLGIYELHHQAIRGTAYFIGVGGQVSCVGEGMFVKPPTVACSRTKLQESEQIGYHELHVG